MDDLVLSDALIADLERRQGEEKVLFAAIIRTVFQEGAARGRAQVKAELQEALHHGTIEELDAMILAL